jgi:hypothetical protein
MPAPVVLAAHVLQTSKYFVLTAATPGEELRFGSHCVAPLGSGPGFGEQVPGMVIEPIDMPAVHVQPLTASQEDFVPPNAPDFAVHLAVSAALGKKPASPSEHTV